MIVKLKRLSPDARIPRYATAGAACFDLHSASVETMFITPTTPQIIPTGIAVEIPPGHVLLMFSRSGHGFNQGTRLANCVGVIDSDYRGEMRVKLTTDDIGCSLQVELGDRVAQAMVIPFDRVDFMLTDALSDTERGDGGYGSTGR